MKILSHCREIGQKIFKVGKEQIQFDKDWSANLCVAILLYVYLIGFFTFNFKIPESAYYLSDLLVIVALSGSVKRVFRGFAYSEVRIASILLFGLLVVGTFSAVFNGFHFNLWIWSGRNWGRYFVYFYLCIALLDEKKVDRLLKFTEKLFHINFFAILIQFMIFYKKISQDAMNGLVGRTTSGANMILLIATIVIVYSQYFSNKCSVKKILCVLTEAAIISVLAELKALILFALVLFGIMLLVNFQAKAKCILRYAMIILVLSVVAAISLRIIVAIYPYFEKLLSIEGLINAVTTESGYGNSGYIDRLTAVRVINQYFFDDAGTWTKLFGLGMGNAEYSSVSAFTSEFYREYGETFRYLYFTVSSIYMEVGMVGLILFVSIPTTLFIRCFIQIKRTHAKVESGGMVFYENVGLGMTALSIMYIWYNNLHRTDLAFLLAFYIAVPISVKYHRMKHNAYLVGSGEK